jgi:hypothetical protein
VHLHITEHPVWLAFAVGWLATAIVFIITMVFEREK